MEMKEIRSSGFEVRGSELGVWGFGVYKWNVDKRGNYGLKQIFYFLFLFGAWNLNGSGFINGTQINAERTD